MNYAIRHPKGKVAPPSRPPLVRVRRGLRRAAGAVERSVRRLRVRMAARSMVAPARRWWAKVSMKTFVQRLSYLGCLILLAWVVEGVYGMVTHRKSPMQTYCEQGQGSNGCMVVYGFLAPFLSIGLATCVFLGVQYLLVRRPLKQTAKKDARRIVPTAGPTTEDVVGRKEVCLVIARALRDRRTRRPHLLVGGVGSGKTSVLVQLTELLARKGATPVPVRLRDAELDGSRLDFHDMGMKRFAELVDRGVLSSHQSERVWRQLCIDDKVVILADGLEETFAEGEEQKERDIQIRHAIDRARRQKLPLVIASRPHSPLENTQAAIIDLEPLSEEAALEYLERDCADQDDHRLDWIVETASVAESPLYLQIARQLRDNHLLDHLGGAKGSEKLDTRDSDRVGLRLQLLETWRSALSAGHVRGNVALSSEDRETTIEVISALAGIGLLRDRLEVGFDELIGKDHDPESRFPGIWERLSERLGVHCPVYGDMRQCRVLLALCATQGEQLGLVEAHGNRVRFPHSIIQAYLGAGYFDVSCRESFSKALEEPGPGRELLIGIVLGSRAGRHVPRWGAVDWTDVVRRLLRAAEDRADPKALEMYTAALEIDQVGKGTELRAVARAVRRRWKWIRSGDPRTIEGAKLTLVHRFGEVLRAIAGAGSGEAVADRVRNGYGSLFSLATVEPSYPIRLAIAQEVGAGGDLAFDALRDMFPLPPKEEMSRDDDPWVQYGRETRDESYVEHRTREFYLRQMAGNDQVREQYAKFEKDSVERRAEIWRKFVMRAWLVPLMAESVGEAHRSQAKERVRLWLGHLEPEHTHSHQADLPLSLEIALAQGFKSAANRRKLHPHVNEEAREFLIAQAEGMLAHARSWFAQLILIQALCLWELPDNSTRSRPGKPGRDHARAEADPVQAVRRWLEMAGSRQDPHGRDQDEDRTPKGDRLHPFVAEAANLAVLALQCGHPERFVWIDEMGTVGNIGSSPADPGAYRKHNLWIPPSVGWTTLHPRAQQLLADVILLLNLTERDKENVDELETRLKRANRSVLPPCLTKDRRPLDPKRTVGMAEHAPPGSACLRDCPFELCPYPAMGSLPRAEVRETFCRQQQALLRPYRRLSYANPLSWARRKRAPWQGMTCKELRDFWEAMAARSRTPSSSTFSLRRKGADMADRERTLHVRVTAKDDRTLHTTLREERPDIGGGPRRTGGPGDEVSIEAYVTERKALEIDGRDGVTVHVLKDATATGRARQAEVGTGNRFAAPDAVPQGLGEKTKDESQER
ncbi:ATP-binding protein [Streptomyces abikoensis]|uniref:ATP-binding protein n=1 Tax=Streptomyces abikoensis TaxID=97398 RepID=UPI003716BF56